MKSVDGSLRGQGSLVFVDFATENRKFEISFFLKSIVWSFHTVWYVTYRGWRVCGNKVGFNKIKSNPTPTLAKFSQHAAAATHRFTQCCQLGLPISTFHLHRISHFHSYLKSWQHWIKPSLMHRMNNAMTCLPALLSVFLLQMQI